MVQIGTIEYKARVTGADDARSKTDDLQESQEQLAESTRESAGSMNRFAGTVRESGKGAGEAGRQIGILDHDMRQLRSTSKGLLGTLGGLFGAGGIAAGGGGLGGLLEGVALGQLVSKAPSLSTLLKGAASLGALVIAADTIGDMIDGEDPITAFVTSAVDFGEFVLNPIGIENNLVEAVVGIGTFILGTMSIASFITGVPISAMIAGAGAKIASFLGVSSLSALVTGAGASIASFLGFASVGALVTTVGSIAALIGGVASLGDLIDGDISSWNLPARFGHALGEGFRQEWPDMADKIHGAFTNNPIHGAGEWTGNVLRGEGRGAVAGENRELSADKETGFIDVDETPVLSQSADAGRSTGNWLEENTPLGAQGARIQSDGLMRVHEGEELVPADVTRDLEMVENITDLGGGGGETTVVEVGQMSITIRASDFDPSNLSRRDVDDLADRLVSAMGNKTSNIAGTR